MSIFPAFDFYRTTNTKYRILWPSLRPGSPPKSPTGEAMQRDGQTHVAVLRIPYGRLRQKKLKKKKEITQYKEIAALRSQ